mgnify:FL=1
MNEMTSLYILSLIIFFINMAIIYKSINKKCMRSIYIVLLVMLKCSVFITMLISNIGTLPVILSDIVIISSGTFAFEFTEYEKIYCILIGSGSLITSYIYTLLMSNKLECIYNLLIIYSISFILNILITFCISQFNNSPIKTIIVLVISYLASMCIIASIGTFDYKKILIGAGIEFIIINVLFGITIKMNIKVNKDEYRNNILNEQIVIYRNEIATKNRYNQKIKSIEHDINNHIISIRNMISDNRNNEAVRYIDEVFNILNNHDNILDTGNIEIDSIMNTKLDEMSSYGITYCHNIMIPCGMNINAMSIVIILGNLLDNSIEAVKKIKKSEEYQKAQNEDINIEIIYDRGTLNINVSNITYRNKENLFYNIEYNGLSLPSGFNTSKENADKHGIGISNIIHIVQQNNGLMSMSRENGIFTTKITLFI